jgi:folate-binding protein YgfZ
MTPSPSLADQYRACLGQGGIVSRDDRRILIITGADRATWLNNLVTNVVKTLQPGDGNYAFAANVKGRSIFDMNLLVLSDALWLDIDARQADAARKHLERYVITEDVRLSDAPTTVARCAVLGPGATQVAANLGFGNLVPMAQLQHVASTLEGVETRMIRHDFAGVMAAEFIATGEGGDRAVRRIESTARDLGLSPIDAGTIEVLRIEAGLPRSVDDIDEDVIPPETGQVERGISYHKGCYLGQEVIERMRSHGVLAHKLVGLRVESDELPPSRSEVRLGDQSIGETRSGCWSVALSSPLSLAYVKTAHAAAGTKVAVRWGECDHPAVIIVLPVRRMQG